eukprot:TRINITY_DN75099_c0_g1_i1.p2 TRINITY_DN75099_c0_g1~~TRINITY_DN75099_c0_g1_i1.p2  ORF type:complete len:194 (+),score=19.04 TRINITY_DN75099_c0_g1_i1:229-810(+)
MGSSLSSRPIGPPDLTDEEKRAALAASAESPSDEQPKIVFLNRTSWTCRVEVSSARAKNTRVHVCNLDGKGGCGEPFVPADPRCSWSVRFVSGFERDGAASRVLDELNDVVCETGTVRVTLAEVPGGAEIARMEYLDAGAVGTGARSGQNGGGSFSGPAFGAGFVVGETLGGGGVTGLVGGVALGGMTSNILR